MFLAFLCVFVRAPRTGRQNLCSTPAASSPQSFWLQPLASMPPKRKFKTPHARLQRNRLRRQRQRHEQWQASPKVQELLRHEMKEKSGEISRLQKEIEERQRRGTTQMCKISRLERKLATVESELGAKTAEMKDLKKQAVNAERTCGALRKGLQTLEATRRQQVASNKALQEETAALKKKLEAANARLKEQDKELLTWGWFQAKLPTAKKRWVANLRRCPPKRICVGMQ